MNDINSIHHLFETILSLFLKKYLDGATALRLSLSNNTVIFLIKISYSSTHFVRNYIRINHNILEIYSIKSIKILPNF